MKNPNLSENNTPITRRTNAPRTVLLVEDDQDQIELVRRAFERDSSPLKLLVARNLQEARRTITEAEPDLIITDVKLPGASGLELLQQDPASTIPVVVMTSFGDEKMAVEAMKGGALDYIAKSHIALTEMPRIAARALREWNAIEEKRLAQKALREIEQREKLILNAIHTGLITSEKETGRIINANRAALEMIGRDLQDILHTSIHHILHPERRDTENETHENVVEGGDAFLDTAAGTAIPVLHNATEFWLEDVLYRVDSIVDITERKRNEEETARLSAAVDQTADAVIIADAAFAIRYVNPAFERMTGYSTDEVLGRGLTELFPPEHSPHPFRIPEGDLETLYRTQFQQQRNDGTTYHAEVIVSPVRNDAGKVVNYVSVMRDATREKALEMQLRQAQKMQAVGQLAGGVAHDFNNLLVIIINSALLLKETIAEDTQQALDLDNIIDAANRGAGLTRQLLTFSKRQPLTPEVTDLNKLVTGCEKMLRRLLGEHIEIELELSDRPCLAKVDNGQIEQAIINLAVNARDAMPEGGILTIRTSRTTVHNGMTDRFIEPADMSAGRYVTLSVSDCGSGIEPDDIPHIFEPFFTTKELGKGTGLGLATVYGICKRHDGQIALSSRLGQGTTIAIYLPEQIKTAPPPTRAAAANDTVPGGTETVLLSEDAPAVRQLGARILGRLGYTVLDAADGSQALEKARNHDGQIDLILTDVVMPGMNGLTLSEKIRELYPDIKVLFASGYPVDQFEEDSNVAESYPIMTKPFCASQLARIVRAILDDDKESIPRARYP